MAAGFVLAYRWDSHCERLMERLRSEREAARAAGPAALGRLLAEVDRRLRVVAEFGYRGFGVNRDLEGALRALREELAREAPGAAPEALAGGQEEPSPEKEALEKSLQSYWELMTGRTPWAVNTAIFQKLFLDTGRDSQTIMRGTVGPGDSRPPRELKVLGNRNFLDMYREAFSTLHAYLEVGFDVLRRIHWLLDRDLDPDAGRFRDFDFEDRNGVTVEHGNLAREMGNLAQVLSETGASFHDTGRFVWDLARSYYLLIGIHPFRDSNGRASRAFLNTMLLKKGLPPISFHSEEEVLALPRYGGAIEDLHRYLLRRLELAVRAYRYEREKLEALGLFGKPIFNVSFDSGVHFRQAEDGARQLLEVRARAYLLPDADPRRPGLVEACRVVVPSEERARALAFYSGFAEGERGEWRRVLPLVNASFSDEVPSDLPGVRAFEVGALVELDEAARPFPFFACSVVSPLDGRVFSNKGLHYWTRLEKRGGAGALALDWEQEEPGRGAGRRRRPAPEAAERWVEPAAKWLGEGRPLANPSGRVSFLQNAGVAFTVRSTQGVGALKVVADLHRADGTRERYLTDAYRVSEWGGGWERWQTHRLPLFPFESHHGPLTYATVGFLLHQGGKAIPSQRFYKLATFEDSTRGATDSQDFHDPTFATRGDLQPLRLDPAEVRRAAGRLATGEAAPEVRALFTRGDPSSPEHPVRELHRDIDWVIERKRQDPRGRHTIRLASFDFDNGDVANHLIWARQSGVEVECIGDWHAVSSFNRSENVARMRRAGIPIWGVVRNTPGEASEGIASMHAKFAIFDDEIVHSSSFNLHFHLWGGNWEHLLVMRSRDAALLHLDVWNAILGGVPQEPEVPDGARLSFHYSLAQARSGGAPLRSQDVIVREIERARSSILLCMFDLGWLVGRSQGGEETDVVSALIAARDRGVKVRVILNGQAAQTGPLPEPWDKDFPRPLKEPVQRLKDRWMEVALAFYWESVYSPIHHKFAVFDGEAVLCGSYNWYEPSLASDELLAVVRDRSLARRFEEECELILQRLRIRGL